VSSLSTSTKECDLSLLFEKYGALREVKVVVDPYTKESRGFGFVTYESMEDADEALRKLDKAELNGKTITVQKAKRARPHSSTPGGYCGPPGASSKYRSDNRRSPSPRRHHRSSGSYSNDR
jgi:transformer-2 protein